MLSFRYISTWLTISGPCFGGIIVTFANWRIIFWLQVAMTGMGLTLSLLFIPSINEKKATNKRNLTSTLSMFNPLRILRQLVYPNVFLAVSVPHL